jgi:fumarate hydratase class II
MANIRKETNSLGGADVSADKLWDTQTLCSLKRFSLGKDLRTSI